MKILHLIFSLEVGGSESMLVDIANSQTMNNEVYVYIINSAYNQTLLKSFNPNVKVRLFNRKVSSKNLIKIIEINYAVLKLNPDIIHCHDSNIMRFLFVHSIFKTLLTVHDINLPLNGVNKYNKVVAISSAVYEHLVHRNIENVSMIYNGINVSKIRYEIGHQSEKIFQIIQVSRLDHLKKGQHILLEALYLLENKYGFSNFHLDFIGEGDSYNYLLNLVSRYNLENKVTFIGLKERSYIYSNLHKYDLLVQPSIFEGFGLTVAEAMASKIPVLVSANDGPMEIIQNGKYGFYFRKEDAADCAEKIKTIMASTKNTHEMVEMAYNYCMNNFDINKTAEHYCNEYRNLINK